MTQSRTGAHRHLPSLPVALIVWSQRCSSGNYYYCRLRQESAENASVLSHRLCFGVPVVPSDAVQEDPHFRKVYLPGCGK